VTRHADVVHVSRHPELFCSGQGTNIPDLPIEIAEFFGSMINMDAPKHTRLRMIVNRSFTPRMVARIDADVRRKARGIVARVAPQGSCDVVAELAAPLPLQIICEMMGIPAEDEEQVFRWTNVILGVGDPEFTTTFEDLLAAGMGMYQYAQALGEDRLAWSVWRAARASSSHSAREGRPDPRGGSGRSGQMRSPTRSCRSTRSHCGWRSKSSWRPGSRTRPIATRWTRVGLAGHSRDALLPHTEAARSGHPTPDNLMVGSTLTLLRSAKEQTRASGLYRVSEWHTGGARR